MASPRNYKLTSCHIEGSIAMRSAFIRISASAAILVFGIKAFEQGIAAGEKVTDLARAVIVTPRDLPSREKKAVAMLVDEVAKRTQVRWPVVAEWPKAEGT